MWPRTYLGGCNMAVDERVSRGKTAPGIHLPICNFDRNRFRRHKREERSNARMDVFRVCAVILHAFGGKDTIMVVGNGSDNCKRFVCGENSSVQP